MPLQIRNVRFLNLTPPKTHPFSPLHNRRYWRVFQSDRPGMLSIAVFLSTHLSSPAKSPSASAADRRFQQIACGNDQVVAKLYSEPTALPCLVFSRLVYKLLVRIQRGASSYLQLPESVFTVHQCRHSEERAKVL